MKLNYFTIYILFANIVSANFNHHTIETNDTMDIYMSEKIVGHMTHNVSWNDSAAAATEYTYMSINTGNGNSISMRETRLFDSIDLLSCAYQEMSSPSGVNSWELKKNNTIWNYTVTVGGNKTQSKVAYVNYNFSSTRRLILGVKGKTIKKGETWNDTSFELLSAQKIISKIKCVDIDKVNSYWIFTNTDDISGRAETVTLDSNCRTIELSFDGIYTAKLPKKTPPGTDIHGAKTVSNKSAGNITDMFSVKADRMANADELISLKPIDSEAPFDESIKFLYIQNKNLWMLRPLPDKCLSSKSLLPDSIKKWLLPSVAIQCNNHEIVKLADSLLNGEKNPCEIIRKLNRYVYSSLQKRNTPTFSNALETLHSGYGDCGEHSVLLAALLRASGIPARVVLGLLYVEDKKAYFYHAQVMAYSGQWIFADPTWNVFPSYGKFIPLMIDDTGSKAVFLSRIINKISIDYVKKGD